jgi:hypothetical protein
MIRAAEQLKPTTWQWEWSIVAQNKSNSLTNWRNMRNVYTTLTPVSWGSCWKCRLGGWMWWFLPCAPSYAGGWGKIIKVWGKPRKKCETLSEKQTKKPKGGDMAQGVEHLLSRHETLNSICSNTPHLPKKVQIWGCGRDSAFLTSSPGVLTQWFLDILGIAKHKEHSMSLVLAGAASS